MCEIKSQLWPISVFPAFLFHLYLFKDRTDWQMPGAPVIPVTFLISSELLSMPAVKRFSVSFARHPTNGMSFILYSSIFRQSSSTSCMTLFVRGGDTPLGMWRFDFVNDIKWTFFHPSFSFTAQPRCLMSLVMFSACTANTTCSACTRLIYLPWFCRFLTNRSFSGIYLLPWIYFNM